MLSLSWVGLGWVDLGRLGRAELCCFFSVGLSCVWMISVGLGWVRSVILVLDPAAAAGVGKACTVGKGESSSPMGLLNVNLC